MKFVNSKARLPEQNGEYFCRVRFNDGRAMMEVSLTLEDASSLYVDGRLLASGRIWARGSLYISRMPEVEKIEWLDTGVIKRRTPGKTKATKIAGALASAGG